MELLLERTSQLYRQAHLERRQLVSTWKDAVTQMNQREKDIKEAETEVDNAKKVSAQKQEALVHEESVMRGKQIENREIEMYIQELNITQSDLRNRLLKLEDTITLKNSEVSQIVCEWCVINEPPFGVA
jgi:coiled-coil domain-containing protein 39